MSEQSRPLARRDTQARATDTRIPKPAAPVSVPAPEDPAREHLTPTIVGVVLFVVAVVVLVIKTLYATP